MDLRAGFALRVQAGQRTERLDGQADGEGRAFPGTAVEGNRGAEAVGGVLDDRQAQARPADAGIAAAGMVRLEETLEDAVLQPGRDAASGVGD